MGKTTVFDPIAIGGSTSLRNRLYRAPVLEGAGDGDDASDRYAKAFVPNAKAGVGLIIQGNSCLFEEGRTSPGMTLVNTRERTMRLAPMVREVHAAGAAIWLQVGHGGLFAMEAWHEPYASQRTGPLLAPSKPRGLMRAMFAATEVHAMSTPEVYEMCEQYGRVASWAREAGYDGVQLASANAKLLDQFLSPFYNRRDDDFGGSPDRRAFLLKVIRDAVARHAGADFTCTVKIPAEKVPLARVMPHVSPDEAMHTARLAQEWGYDSITPVEVSVFPDTTLSRGGVPTSLRTNEGMRTRLAKAAPSRFKRATLHAGYEFGGRFSPFEPVWNGGLFRRAKQELDVPVLAVGGIRTRSEIDQILGSGDADLVGIGRPFYAEPDLPTKLLGDSAEPVLCENSNLCVPAQMLGMKGLCYNPDVRRLRISSKASRDIASKDASVD